jgi:hypothetical protein
VNGFKGMGEQTEITSFEFDAALDAIRARKESLQINFEYQKRLKVFNENFSKEYPKKILIGESVGFWIEKKEFNYEFYAKLVYLIIANEGKKTTNIDITCEAQKSFPDELINKNIWAKKLSPKMKKSLNLGLADEWVKLLAKAATLSVFKKLVISSFHLKLGSNVYKPTIEITDLVLAVNGVVFPIQKNSTTKNSKSSKNSKKHEYSQIRVSLDPFLAALKSKKPSKKKV